MLVSTREVGVGGEEGLCSYKADMMTALPVVLAHCDMIRIEAMVMSIIGGLLIYGTIISFTMFFREQEEF